MRRIITLLTDFGLSDYFVAEMKGVILSINPAVKIVDISHNIEKFSIVQASFVLVCAYKWFPKGTIHVVVVDSGVGTKRRPIIVETENYYFVGPDNGVLWASAMKDGIKNIYEIDIRKFEKVSLTFHGRDLFAPVAAYISLGEPLTSLGRKINELVTLDIFKVSVSESVIEGFVVHIDSFGNIITGIENKHLKEIGIDYGDSIEVSIGNLDIKTKLLPAYGHVKPGELLALINSEGFLEIAANLSSAAHKLRTKVGDRIVVRKK